MAKGYKRLAKTLMEQLKEGGYTETTPTPPEPKTPPAPPTPPPPPAPEDEPDPVIRKELERRKRLKGFQKLGA